VTSQPIVASTTVAPSSSLSLLQSADLRSTRARLNVLSLGDVEGVLDCDFCFGTRFSGYCSFEVNLPRASPPTTFSPALPLVASSSLLGSAPESFLKVIADKRRGGTLSGRDALLGAFPSGSSPCFIAPSGDRIFMGG